MRIVARSSIGNGGYRDNPNLLSMKTSTLKDFRIKKSSNFAQNIESIATVAFQSPWHPPKPIWEEKQIAISAFEIRSVESVTNLYSLHAAQLTSPPISNFIKLFWTTGALPVLVQLDNESRVIDFNGKHHWRYHRDDGSIAGPHEKSWWLMTCTNQ